MTNIAGAIFEKKQKDYGRSGLFHVTSPPDLLREPSILLLPSNSAVNQIDAPANRQISGQLKYFYKDGYRHFGLAYSDMSSFAHSYAAYHEANERGWSNDAQDLVEQLIAPNIPSVNNRTGDDRAAQLIDCFYRFRNLKICSHSYGGMMASQLGNAVNAFMDNQGYKPDEKALLIPQIMVLNIAGITSSANEITKNNPTFTVCDLKSLNDTTLRLANNTLSLIENFLKIISAGKRRWPLYTITRTRRVFIPNTPRVKSRSINPMTCQPIWPNTRMLPQNRILSRLFIRPFGRV
jgi:hypothetical protein